MIHLLLCLSNIILLVCSNHLPIIYNSCETARKQGSNSSGMHTIWKNGLPPDDYSINHQLPNPGQTDQVCA